MTDTSDPRQEEEMMSNDNNTTTTAETEHNVTAPDAMSTDMPPEDASAPEQVADKETDDAEPKSKREARYRVQLRETEAERDTLVARIDTMLRAEVERIAGDYIEKPEALWASDTTLDDLLNEDGLVDAEKVTAAARTAQAKLGLELSAAERRKRGPVVPREGTGVDRSTRNVWKDAFN